MFGTENSSADCNFRLDTENFKGWGVGDRVRLTHGRTHHKLHSHSLKYNTTFNGTSQTVQEVCPVLCQIVEGCFLSLFFSISREHQLHRVFVSKR